MSLTEQISSIATPCGLVALFLWEAVKFWKKGSQQQNEDEEELVKPHRRAAEAWESMARAHKEEIEALRTKLQDVSCENTQLVRDLRSANERLDALQQLNLQLQQSNNTLQQQLTDVTRRLANLETK